MRQPRTEGRDDLAGANTCPLVAHQRRDGQLRPHRRADLISKICPVAYDPDARADRWLAFLTQVMAGDGEKIDETRLESPLAANDLPTRDGSAAAMAAQKEFDAIGEICRSHDIPWVLLSGGAAHDKFERVLEYAYAAGAGGFLAGRTIWLDAVRSHFPDLAAVSSALKKQSVAILNSLSGLTGTHAPLWQPRFPKFDNVRQEGDFARTYFG